MRTDQYVGLNERAKNLVARYTKVLREEFEGAFGNKFPLYDYKNDCGHVVYRNMCKLSRGRAVQCSSLH
jgi:hypothetical protein